MEALTVARRKLNDRAIEYRETRKLPDPYCYEVQDAWLAGYRAAMRDVKRCFPSDTGADGG
jgi:hypothetical protein